MFWIKFYTFILTLLLLLAFPINLKAEILPLKNLKNCDTWIEWQLFKSDFISPDGRVIDWQSDKSITTSEGQSYALFFSLVANDKQMFKKLLIWSQNNLAFGNMYQNLPAWLWGKKIDASYGVIDKNPASDADLWFAYTLVEAGRIWQNNEYKKLGYRLLEQILEKETQHLPGLGLTILPAPYGFKLDENLWRLNPSYYPLFMLKRFTKEPGFLSWKNIYKTASKIILKTSLKGTSPDWVLYSKQNQFHFTSKYSDLGSYDAIRVYLWAGMMHESADSKKQLLKQFEPVINYFNQFSYMPLNTFSTHGIFKKQGPLGFSIAMLPLLKDSDKNKIFSIRNQSQKTDHNNEVKPNYYERVLSLFSLGFIDNIFKFNPNGYLEIPEKNLKCA